MNAHTRSLEEHACPVRDILDRIGDAWSYLIMLELAKAPARFNGLCRVIDGISPRMLTVKLRSLQRDGIVNREVIPLSPPQVEYSLTELGVSLQLPLLGLQEWATKNQTNVRKARRVYDKNVA